MGFYASTKNSTACELFISTPGGFGFHAVGRKQASEVYSGSELLLLFIDLEVEAASPFSGLLSFPRIHIGPGSL